MMKLQELELKFNYNKTIRKISDMLSTITSQQAIVYISNPALELRKNELKAISEKKLFTLVVNNVPIQ